MQRTVFILKERIQMKQIQTTNLHASALMLSMEAGRISLLPSMELIEQYVIRQPLALALRHDIWREEEWQEKE